MERSEIFKKEKEMKKVIVLWVMALLLSWVGGGLWAHGDDKTPDQSLTGEVVCLSCYLGHGAMGDIHAKCAKQCFAKGLPVGLKVGEKLYLLVGEKHGTVNKMMSSRAGKQVTVTGHISEQDGMRMMTVETVEKQGAAGKGTSEGKKAAVLYTCPMHSEVVSDKPGKCPKCGMDLVKKK